MRRNIAAILIILGMVTLVSIPSTALAAVNFHQTPPMGSYSSATTTYSVTGFTVSGLGNLPLTETLVVTASYAATCVNHGGNVAPGIKTVQVASPPVTQGPISAHNGTFTFGSLSYTLVAPNPASYSATAYCPNGNWTISSFTLTATSGTLTLSNQNGVLYGPIALS